MGKAMFAVFLAVMLLASMASARKITIQNNSGSRLYVSFGGPDASKFYPQVSSIHSGSSAYTTISGNTYYAYIRLCKEHWCAKTIDVIVSELGVRVSGNDPSLQSQLNKDGEDYRLDVFDQ